MNQEYYIILIILNTSFLYVLIRLGKCRRAKSETSNSHNHIRHSSIFRCHYSNASRVEQHWFRGGHSQLDSHTTDTSRLSRGCSYKEHFCRTTGFVFWSLVYTSLRIQCQSLLCSTKYEWICVYMLSLP